MLAWMRWPGAGRGRRACMPYTLSINIVFGVQSSRRHGLAKDVSGWHRRAARFLEWSGVYPARTGMVQGGTGGRPDHITV